VKTYITGASGRLGRSVLRVVKAIPLVRKESGLENEKITDFSVQSLKKILRNADCLIHLAGSVKTYDPKELYSSNVELTRKLLEACPPKCRVVFASSISVYGKHLPSLPADENTSTNPDSDYAHAKLEAENLVRARGKCCILRIGTLYGPAFSDYFTILRMLEKGKMQIMGDGNNHVPFVHVEDVAAVFPKAMRRNGTFLLTGPPCSQYNIYRIACRELGAQMPHKHMPVWQAMLAARAQELQSILGKKPKLTREHISILSADRMFSYRRAMDSLGFSPRKIDDGIREMVKEYKKSNLL
jgi:dihydroflavonol-4-reductase